MKRVIYGILFLALVGTFVVACQKEELHKPTTSGKKNKVKDSSNKNNFSDEMALLKPKKGQISCVVYDSGGNAICAGIRCGTPVGDCGRKETACNCKTKSSVNYTILNNGMTLLEFIEAWNNKQQRKLSIKK